MSLSYDQSLAIATTLANQKTRASDLLREACVRYNRGATFIIMRGGDPRGWETVPRIETRGRPRKDAFTDSGKARLDGPFTLRHLDSGKTATAMTINELADRTRIKGGYWKQALANVVTKRILSVEGWYLASNLDRTITLQDVYGNVYAPMTIREYVLTHRGKIGGSVGSALALLNGRKRFIGGLALASTEIERIMTPRATRIKEVSVRRDGVTTTASSIPKLAAKLHIDQASLYQLAYGFKEQARGFELAKVQTETQTVLALAD